jgi:hypothetical protein
MSLFTWIHEFLSNEAFNQINTICQQINHLCKKGGMPPFIYWTSKNLVIIKIYYHFQFLYYSILFSQFFFLFSLIKILIWSFIKEVCHKVIDFFLSKTTLEMTFSNNWNLVLKKIEQWSRRNYIQPHFDHILDFRCEADEKDLDIELFYHS